MWSWPTEAHQSIGRSKINQSPKQVEFSRGVWSESPRYTVRVHLLTKDSNVVVEAYNDGSTNHLVLPNGGADSPDRLLSAAESRPLKVIAMAENF